MNLPTAPNLAKTERLKDIWCLPCLLIASLVSARKKDSKKALQNSKSWKRKWDSNTAVLSQEN